MSRASPFFRSPLYTNPSRHADHDFAGVPPSPPQPEKPKVVSIPVHFVGSDDDNKRRADRAAAIAAAAAIKIQKAFRGFLVRKNVRIARGIEVEVDEIEMRIRREQEMDLIVRDEKERLRINEMLMRLLLRLDSVRGVRDYRKRVIRRVIALQEMLDSIPTARSADQTLENAAAESVETKPDDLGVEGVETQTLETADQVDPMEMHHVTGANEAETLASGEQISSGWELLETKEANNDVEVEKNQKSLMEDETIPESTVTPVESEERGMKDVMERMVAENEKLKGLVALLCERSAQQCRLMGGLAQRVEHLEKLVEKMERKKKRKDGCSLAASVDKKLGRDNNNNNKQL